jgi:hypothetical protein
MDAHFVFERTAENGISFTQRAVWADKKLGYQEKRNAFGPRRGIRQTSQHEVKDVGGQVMLSGRDENLLTRDAEGAIKQGLCG